MRNLIIVILFVLFNQACSNINRRIRVVYIKKSDYSQIDTFLTEVKEVVKKEKYSILFFEKIERPLVNQLIKALPDYEFYVGKPENGSNGGGLQPIAYKKDDYTIQTRAYLELNYPTPSSPINHSSGHVVAVKLRETGSGRTFFALNASISEPLLVDQIYNIHKIIKSYTDNLPIILTGNFPASDETTKLLTGHWFNLVKLESAAPDLYNKNSNGSNVPQIFVNGFLNIDKADSEKNKGNITTTSSAISFNKNYRDTRSQSQLYPMTQPQPYFGISQIVFNTDLAIYITNPNPLARIVYTSDESDPTLHSPVYQHPIIINESCRIKMRSVQKESEMGNIVCRYFIKTQIENYNISEITLQPSETIIPKEEYHFLTDKHKGDESRTHKSWLPIEPTQTVALKIELNDTTELKHIYLSFATPGKLIMPAISLTVNQEGNIEEGENMSSANLVGGSLSQCGTEGWIKLDVQQKVKSMVLNIKLSPKTTVPLYIDEIVLQ